jgi:hypothetical protein
MPAHNLPQKNVESSALAAPRKASWAIASTLKKPALAVKFLAPAVKAPVYLAGLAVGSAMRAPTLAKKAGARGARAAFLAGHLAHGGAQTAVAGALFKLSVAAAASEGFAHKLGAGPGKAPTRLSRMLDLGISAAVEFYPLISALAMPGQGHLASPTPSTPPLADLPFSEMFKLGAHAHREMAADSLGRVQAWRARRRPQAAESPALEAPRP